MDPHGDCPYPKVLSIQELLTQYLDFCGRPSRSFFKQLFMFASTDESRNRLRDLFERDRLPQEEFDTYTDQNTYADVLFEFEKDSLPPFEYLLSMIPTNTPRFYSIASSPLVDENKLELLVVKNDWKDSAKKQRNGLNTQYLFNAKKGDKVAVQVHTGILQPPELDEELDTPVVMFCLGAGLAPFRGFLQHRQALIELKNHEEEETGVHTDLGPATLYFGSRHRAHDYYLENYFKDCIEQGALTAIHTAFSRDGLGPDGKKRYVYSVIGEEPMEMAKALGMEDGTPNDKARVYYCGPARGIPEAIQESMTKALIAEGGIHMDEDEAKEYIDRMVNKDKRFNAECF
jgi:NADPH-ferrihemoprotein reductase